MIRVVYRWQVQPENFDTFQAIWRKTTNNIHLSVSGAQGSFMLRSVENDTEVLTIAKWTSMEAWQSFWGNKNPQEMQSMMSLAKRIMVEAYEEIEDQSKG